MNRENIIQKLIKNTEIIFNTYSTSGSSIESKKSFCLEVFPRAVGKIIDDGYEIICMDGMYGVFDPNSVAEPAGDGDGFLQAKALTKVFADHTEKGKSEAVNELYNTWKEELRDNTKQILALYLPLIPAEIMEVTSIGSERFITFFDVAGILELHKAEFDI